MNLRRRPRPSVTADIYETRARALMAHRLYCGTCDYCTGEPPMPTEHPTPAPSTTELIATHAAQNDTDQQARLNNALRSHP